MASTDVSTDMQHPILDNRKYLGYYLLVWSLITVLHFVMVYVYSPFPLHIIITDSLTANLVAALLGLSLWFSLRYGMGEEQHSMAGLLLIHLVSALVLLGIWIGITYLILQILYPSQAAYIQFFRESTTYRLVGGLFLYSILVLFYYIMIYYEDIKDKSENENRLNILVKEAEIENLKTQINPHFLFNSLNSVSALTMANPEKAQEMVIMLSELLRYSVNGTKHRFVKIQEEVETMQKYIDIEKIRFGEKLQVDMQMEDECLDFYLPPMILQPLIENAIKYGKGQSGDHSYVNISIDKEGEQCCISIRNNYDSEYVNNAGEGIGLKNIKKRLAIMYERNYSFETYDNGKEFKAVMILPQTKPNDDDKEI